MVELPGRARSIASASGFSRICRAGELAPSFTIHDRGDSEDLLDAGPSRIEKSTSQKALFRVRHCVASTRAPRERPKEPLTRFCAIKYPWCATGSRVNALLAPYVAAKQSQQIIEFDDCLLLLGKLLEDSALAGEIGARFDMYWWDESPGHQRLQVRSEPGCEAGRSGRHGCG